MPRGELAFKKVVGLKVLILWLLEVVSGGKELAVSNRISKSKADRERNFVS